MTENKGFEKEISTLYDRNSKEYSNFLDDNEKLEELESNIKDNTVFEIDIDEIEANPNQPRKVFDDRALSELSVSIERYGVIMPIVVNKVENGKYLIIAGERRYRASKLAGKKTIPAIIKNYNERIVQEVALIENIQREDLNPIEYAYALKSLMENYNLTQEELSQKIGKSRSSIANTLRLLSLEKEVIDLVKENKLSSGHARALIMLPKQEQVIFANKTVEKGLSVRQIENEVKNFFNPSEKQKQLERERMRAQMSVEFKDLINRMQQDFGTKVSAMGNDRKGRIYIDYYSRDDLDRIVDILDLIEKNKK